MQPATWCFHFLNVQFMKNQFFFISITLLLFGSLPARAQNRLRGEIREGETNEAVFGAIVIIHDLKRGALSDSAGRFSIAELPAGTFLVEVRGIGYSPQTQRIRISGETNMQIVLQHAATEINEVTITGTSGASQRLLNPVPVTALGIDDLRQNAATNAVSALGQLPGVSQISTGPAISKPVIRGLGYNRVLVLSDGIRQEGQQWGDEHGVEIDANAVERVEVIKGPGSLMYGSDALAGVVNFISTNPVEAGRITGLFESAYQSNSGLYGWSANTQGNLDGISWLARASAKTAGNFQNRYDGRVYNSGFDEMNFNGYAGLNKRWGYSYLRVSSFDQKLALVEGERDSLGRFLVLQAVNDSTVEEVAATENDLDAYRIDVPNQSIRHLRVQLDNKFFMDRQSLAASFAFQRNIREEFADPLDPFARELAFHLQTLNYDLKWFLPSWQNWETALGVNGMYQQNENKGEEQLIPDYELLDAGVFAVTQKTFSRSHIAFGLRFDHRSLRTESLLLDSLDQPTTDPAQAASTKFGALERRLGSVSGSAGWSYSFTPRLILKANVARAFRSPNLSELSSNGKHEGAFRYEYGNSALKAETATQGDLGLVYDGKHFSAELAAFGGVIGHFIYLQKLESAGGGDSIPDPSDPAPAFRYTQGDAQRFGGEASIDLHPHPYDWLHFENTFSFVKATLASQPDSMRFIPFTPAPRFRSELRAHFEKRGKFFRNMFAKLELEHTFAQRDIYSAFGTETATPAYTLLNAAAGFSFTTGKGKTIFDLVFVAQNFTDVAYQDHLSRLKYAPENPLTGRTGVFAPGRNFCLKLAVPLTFRKPKADQAK